MDDTRYDIHKFEPIVTGIWSSSPLISVKIVPLVESSNLFKISNLVYNGREIVSSVYSSLQGQFMVGIVSWQVAVCECQN